ncbi:pentapeptide repeat-containing protein [Actinomadura rudentiformis]
MPGAVNEHEHEPAFVAIAVKGLHASPYVVGRGLINGANLTGADLTGAHLTGANLTSADLTGADLTGADLRTSSSARSSARSAHGAGMWICRCSAMTTSTSSARRMPGVLGTVYDPAKLEEVRSAPG